MNSTLSIEAELEDLIAELQLQTDHFSWTISNDSLMNVLGLRKEDFYRELYSFRKHHSQSLSLKEFTEKEGDLLCSFLKQIYKSDLIEDLFLKAGLYFNDSSLQELEIYFKIYLQNALRKHKLDRELIQLLIGATVNFDDAFDSYFEDKFEIDFLVVRSVQNFISDKGIDFQSGSEDYLRKSLLDKIKAKKIKLNELTDEYKERFYYEIYGHHKQDGRSKKRTKMDSEKNQLLEYFKLSEESTLKDLKKSFKEMLLIFHPDVNKDGLEKTQEIIENYNKLFELIR